VHRFPLRLPQPVSGCLSGPYSEYAADLLAFPVPGLDVTISGIITTADQ
jgi:hypothetical protein